jgi:hypothetical protein
VCLIAAQSIASGHFYWDGRATESCVKFFKTYDVDLAKIKKRLTKEREDAKKAAEAAAAAKKKPAKKKAEKGAKLIDQIRVLLTAAGPEGTTVQEIGKALGVRSQNVHVWFSTTGKKQDWIAKVGEARFALIDRTPAEKEAA